MLDGFQHVALVFRLRQDGSKLIGADACDIAGRAAACDQAHRQLLQQLVADRAAKSIIDAFELLRIGDHNRHPTLLPVRGADAQG